MEVIDRRSFPLHWQPGQDLLGGDLRGLLRADNMVPDEEGVLSTRLGSQRVWDSPLSTGAAIHSHLTTQINGTRYRLLGAGDDFWVTGEPGITSPVRRESGITGSGLLAMGSYGGQIFYARGSTTRKYDGTGTGGDNGRGCRNWGVQSDDPLPAPSFSVLDADGTTFSDFDGGDGWIADDGEVVPSTGQDDNPTSAIEITSGDALEATVTHDYGSEVDFNQYDGGQEGADEDSISLYMAIGTPNQVESVTIMADCNGDSLKLFADDYYYFTFQVEVDLETFVDPELITKPTIRNRKDLTGYFRESVEANLVDPPTNIIKIRPGRTPEENNAQWQQLRVRRDNMKRVGTTTGKDWSTIRAVRIVVKWRQDIGLGEEITPTTIKFDDWTIEGGAGRTLTGEYAIRYQYVYNSGVYQARSPISEAVFTGQIQNCGLRATIPNPVDPQVNQIDVFVLGGSLDQYYRFGTTTQTDGLITVDLTLSERDALEQDIAFGNNVQGPPDGIVAIIAPHFGRLIAITNRGIYPSMIGDPESFNPNHVNLPFDSTEEIKWAARSGTAIVVATTKDLYYYEGRGEEQPDGTIAFTLRALNTGAPAASADFCQEGDLTVYLSTDGLRNFDGGNSTPIRGDIDLLYRGYSRYGVTSANLGFDPNRFRMCMANTSLYVLYGSYGDDGSPEVHRFDLQRKRWYRYLYPFNIYNLYHEPQGNVVAGTDNGYNFFLELGDDDVAGSTATPISGEFWTVADPGNDPRIRKEMFDLRVYASSDEDVPLSVGLYLNGSNTLAATVTGIVGTMSDFIWQTPLSTPFQQVQLRGTFSGRMKLRGYGMSYRPRPLPLRFWDSGFVDTGYNDYTWIDEVDVKVCAQVPIQIKMYFDNILFGTWDVVADTDVARPYTVPLPRTYFGYQPRIVVEATNPLAAPIPETSFELYWVRFRFRKTGKVTGKPVLMIQPAGASGYVKAENAT